MKYYIPDWDDRVDPKYDFGRDHHSSEHNENPVLNDVYMWDIFGMDKVPFDGVLVSRMTIMGNKKKYEQAQNEGIHNVLRLPKSFEIMADCGAWGYINEEKPIFDTAETLEYYFRCGFNYGVSIDHLIIPGQDKETQEFRWKLTLENAQAMHDLWQSKDEYYSSLRIIGVAQGWDPESYRNAVRKLLEIGYDYIAIGGIAKSNSGSDGSDVTDTKTVYNVVKAVWLEIKKWMQENGKKRVDLHTFGVARPELMSKLANLGVTSCDSASFLRKSWMSLDKNYMQFSADASKEEEKFYAAIRIRYSEDNETWKSLSPSGQHKLKQSEMRALTAVRDYDSGRTNLKSAIEAAIDFEKEYVRIRTAYEKKNAIEGHTHKATQINEEFRKKQQKQANYLEKLPKMYEKVLMDKPWRSCPCTICKSIGVEVVIFRGNNRNRRRGFHNIFAFYQRFRKKVPRILVLTFCSATKDPSERLLPAYKRYGASNNIRTFWNNVHDLPVEVAMFSAKLGIVNWCDKIPNYDYKIQQTDVPKFIAELREKLAGYDKVFFIGLNGYRKVIETIKNQTKMDIDIFPKIEFAFYEGKQRHLDILEYQKQMKLFRQAILKEMPKFINEQGELKNNINSKSSTLDQYIQSMRQQ